MTELDWPYTDEDNIGCYIELFPEDSRFDWDVGIISHKSEGGVSYQIAYDLIRELHAQKAEIATLESDSDQIMKERDEAEEMADKLAYAIAPVEIIGEHSNCNNPRVNALEQIDIQKAEIERLTVGWDQEQDHCVYLNSQIERYRSALQEIRGVAVGAALNGTEAMFNLPFDDVLKLATKALEDKQQ